MRGDLQEGYFALLDANFLSSWCQFPFSRAQNRHFCAQMASRTPIFGHFEHKIGVFVRFWPSGPPFLGFSSTKSAFLCSGSMCWGLLGSCYSGRAARVVLPGECCSVYLFAPRSAKSSFLKVAASVKSSACMPAAMAPSTLAGLSSVKRHSEA